MKVSNPAKNIFDEVSFRTSELVTKRYSTSFSMGIKFLDKSLHDGIYAIYGFVRLADEIVDSFHNFEQAVLLKDFINETWIAIDKRISLNPVLNSFQWVVNQYQIDHDTIRSFFKSMEMDLSKSHHDHGSYKEYIWGSADVVGLMCLSVFTNGDQSEYERLKPHAISLGSAFQKVNFLRDLAYDEEDLCRTYFPQLTNSELNEINKQEIISEIKNDFSHAFIGIAQLPLSSRFGVMSAYEYYKNLLSKLKNTDATKIKSKRVRISNFKKVLLSFLAYFKSRFIQLSILMLCIATNANASNPENLTKLRKAFQYSNESKQSAKDYIELSESLYEQDSSNKIYQGYKASAQMVNAKYGINPLRKLREFNNGKSGLETIIEENNDNLELRYIRYATQYYAPFFLNYNANLKEDRDFILSRLRDKDDTNQALENEIRSFFVRQTKEYKLEELYAN
jgi:15-cis-phytoene synthase